MCVWLKRLACIGFVLTSLVVVGESARAFSSPGAPTGYVTDFAHVFTAEQAETLRANLRAHEDQTTQEIAVVTVDTLGDETVETYAVQLFQQWGIGKRGKDNGVLILLAKNDRKVRIEVGYGLEGILTDSKSAGIIARATPFFKESKYDVGLSQMATDVETVLLGQEIDLPPKGEFDGGGIEDTIWFFVFIAMFTIVPAIIFVGWVIHIITRILRSKTKFNPYIDGPMGGWTSGSSSGSSSPSSSSSDSSSSSSSSDSFGGGSSGGGGASGSW